MDTTPSNNPQDISLKDPEHEPTDTVSCIAWAPNTTTRTFACSSWDSQIRIYDITTSDSSLTLKAALKTEHPCLSICWQGTVSHQFAGSIDGTISLFDINTTKPIEVGQHAGVKDIHWVPATRTLISLGFDRVMRLWDTRQKNAIAGVDVGGKVLCSDLVFPTLALGMSGEQVLILDLPNIQKKMKSCLKCIDSPLGPTSQLLNVTLASDHTRVAMSGHDGRGNISDIVQNTDGTVNLKQYMNFKARRPENRSYTLFPVHGIGFHPTAKNFLYTATEHTLLYWDINIKNRIREFIYNPLQFTKTKLSPDGAVLAYAFGYDWSHGIERDQSCLTSIRARFVQEDELVYGTRE